MGVCQARQVCIKQRLACNHGLSLDARTRRSLSATRLQMAKGSQRHRQHRGRQQYFD